MLSKKGHLYVEENTTHLNSLVAFIWHRAVEA